MLVEKPVVVLFGFLFVKKEDEDEEAEVPSETEAGEEGEVDVCTVERIPALCSRCEL